MRRLYLLIIVSTLATAPSAWGQEGKISTKFYGFVRGDGSIDNRKSVSANEGLFLLYPTDRLYDAAGEDLNAIATSGFYGFNSRIGVNFAGLRLFNSNVTGQMEGDFAGFGGANGNSSIFRIRQAFIKMNWDKTALTIGQTWHPMFYGVTPDVISLSTGAPFSPFNRSPQFRFEYKPGDFNLTAAAIWQFQFTSNGSSGKSNIYQRNAVVPELFLGGGYSKKGVAAGAGINYLTIMARTQATVGTDIFKVSERFGSISYFAYAKFTQNLFSIGAKSIYGQNLSNMTMLGGYGISEINPLTGAQTYTNFTHTSSFVSVAYGKIYKGSVFGGYTKNLGTRKPLVEGSSVYGDGLALNNLYRICGTFTYNIPNFMVGLEYEMTTAGYGDLNTLNYRNGRYDSSHNVTNHRVVLVTSYSF